MKYQLAVIGGGPAGYTAAEAAGKAGLSVVLFEKKSEQAARNLLNDFEATKTSLSNVAGSLKLCDNPKLRALGYRRINFLSHRYFMLYRIENDTVYVDNIFHELQDYENKMN